MSESNRVLEELVVPNSFLNGPSGPDIIEMNRLVFLLDVVGTPSTQSLELTGKKVY